MTRVKLIIAAFAATTASDAALAYCRPPLSSEGAKSQAAYVLRNSDLVGIGLIEATDAPGGGQSLKPLTLAKGEPVSSIYIGPATNPNGSVKLDTVKQRFNGETGSLVLFALNRTDGRYVVSECAAPLIEGPGRIGIITAIFRKSR